MAPSGRISAGDPARERGCRLGTRSSEDCVRKQHIVDSRRIGWLAGCVGGFPVWSCSKSALVTRRYAPQFYTPRSKERSELTVADRRSREEMGANGAHGEVRQRSGQRDVDCKRTILRI